MVELGGDDGVLMAAFSCAGVGMVVVDGEGRVVRLNPYVERVTGYSESELLGRRFVELSHPEDVAAGESAFRTLIAGERESYEVERRYLRKAGGVVWARVRVSIASRGASPLVVAVLEDITERRQLAHVLGERVKELTALHATSRLMSDPSRPLGDRLHDVVSLLPAAMQFPDVTSARIGIGDREYMTPGYTRTPWLLRTTFATAAGIECAIDVAYHAERPFLREERDLLESLGEILRTAIDRERAEEDRRRTRERLDFALASAGMGVWEWDLTTGNVFWSEHLATMIGIARPPAARIGEYAHLIHPDDREPLLGVARRVAEVGGSVEVLDARIRRPDGSWRPVHVFGHRSSDSRVICVFVDVTVRQALEAALRTAQKLEALGQVAGGVAHDFNNLLQVIISGADSLRDAVAGNAELAEIASDVYAAGTRGIGLTRQLLSFSRGAAFHPTVVDVNASIRTLEPILNRLIKGRARLALELEADAPAVWADPSQIEQVVLNLVVNARDAMEAPGSITVTTSRSGDAHTVIGVRDNGPGIPPEIQAQIFDPFFTTKPAGKGTGLGLAVVQSVARQWHGRVTLESAPGQGAHFRVHLPAHVGQSASS